MNKRLLKAKIIANGDTQADLAKSLNLSLSNLSLRINGHTDFRQSEINAIINRYHLSDCEVREIFFADVVS